jgi:hypothetical protein
MPKRPIFRIFLILLIITIYAGTGCVTGNKGRSVGKNSQASKLNASQLGRNKYYFSTNYQKKLTRNVRKR